jgi:serpin B
MVRCFEIPTDDHQGAQFDKLTSTRRSEDRLCFSAVVHQTYVDVSEVGTEAAAATALSEGVSDGDFETPKTRPLIPIFKANKPFIFLIRDRKTASILFLGRYVSPPNP